MARTRTRGKHPAEKVLAKLPPIPYLESGLPSIEPFKTGAVRRFRRPEGDDLRSLQREVLRGLADAEQRLPLLHDEILACAREADPLMLYSRLVTLAGMRRAAPGHVIFGMDATVEFYGGLVTSLPAEEVVARTGAEYHPNVLYELDHLLREYAVTEQQVDQGHAMREGASDPLAGARHLLEFEQRFDRMLGYPEQLRPIFQAIADPLADRSRSALGFALGDALIIADAYSEMLAERRNRTADEFQVVLDRIPPDADADAVIQYFAAHSAGVATFGAAPAEEDLAGVLAERTGIARDEVANVVTALATPLGSQSTLTVMQDTNTLRRRSIISLPDGRHLWAVPDDFIHTALDWAAEVCQQDTKLIEIFDRRRQTACEELTHQALAAVFGEQDVHPGVTYPADGQRPDIDVLVATLGASIVVEAKAGRFTDAARRGAPERVKKKSREFIDKALDQNERTIAHLRHGARDLRDKHKRRLAIPNAPHMASVIVTLDRVDPFATHMPDGGKRGGIPAAGTWLVNLADLMMAADILRHPAEFYSYVVTRARINKTGGPRIFVEADALGCWCEERIAPVAARPGELALLSATSQTMNDYYTFVPTETRPEPPPRPASGVPPEVLSALDEVLHQRPEHWHGLVTEALAVSPARWETVRKAIKHSTESRLSRRAKKRARRATSGVQLSANLSVCVGNHHEPAVEPLSTSLVINIPERVSRGAPASRLPA